MTAFNEAMARRPFAARVRRLGKWTMRVPAAVAVAAGCVASLPTVLHGEVWIATFAIGAASCETAALMTAIHHVSPRLPAKVARPWMIGSRLFIPVMACRIVWDVGLSPIVTLRVLQLFAAGAIAISAADMYLRSLYADVSELSDAAMQ